MPGMTGLEVATELKRRGVPVRVIILTTFARAGYLRRALESGASGYLLKDIKGNGLIEAIRKAAAGEQLIDPDTIDRVRRGWTSSAGADPRLRLLSPQERRILDHVAEGLTNRQIGEAMSLAEKTVKNYITAVLGKLGMERRTQAAVFAVSQKPRARGRPPK